MTIETECPNYLFLKSLYWDFHRNSWQSSGYSIIETEIEIGYEWIVLNKTNTEWSVNQTALFDKDIGILNHFHETFTIGYEISVLEVNSSEFSLTRFVVSTPNPGFKIPFFYVYPAIISLLILNRVTSYLKRREW